MKIKGYPHLVESEARWERELEEFAEEKKNCVPKTLSSDVDTDDLFRRWKKQRSSS